MTVAPVLVTATPIPPIRLDHPVIEVGRDRASNLKMVLDAEMQLLLSQSSYIIQSKHHARISAKAILSLDDRIGAISNIRGLLDEGRLEDAEMAYMSHLG